MDPRLLLAGMTEKGGSCPTYLTDIPPSAVIPDIVYRESIGSLFRMDPSLLIAGMTKIRDGSSADDRGDEPEGACLTFGIGHRWLFHSGWIPAN
jgi:hypothetical protein